MRRATCSRIGRAATASRGRTDRGRRLPPGRARRRRHEQGDREGRCEGEHRDPPGVRVRLPGVGRQHRGRRRRDVRAVGHGGQARPRAGRTDRRATPRWADPACSRPGRRGPLRCRLRVRRRRRRGARRLRHGQRAIGGRANGRVGHRSDRRGPGERTDRSRRPADGEHDERRDGEPAGEPHAGASHSATDAMGRRHAGPVSGTRVGGCRSVEGRSGRVTAPIVRKSHPRFPGSAAPATARAGRRRPHGTPAKGTGSHRIGHRARCPAAPRRAPTAGRRARATPGETRARPDGLPRRARADPAL